MAGLHQLFMTTNDMIRWLAGAEEKFGKTFKYVRCYSDEPIPEIQRCQELPGLGVSMSGDKTHNMRCFIVPATTVIVQESYQLNTGETRYRIHPLVNAGMVAFDIGGVCDSSRIVVTSEFGIGLTDDVSVTLNKILWQIARKQGTVSGRAAVGAEALELHRAGYRLTDRVQAQSSYDLVVRGVGQRAMP